MRAAIIPVSNITANKRLTRMRASGDAGKYVAGGRATQSTKPLDIPKYPFVAQILYHFDIATTARKATRPKDTAAMPQYQLVTVGVARILLYLFPLLLTLCIS